MPDFLHQRYVGMYTHLQGGRLKVLELSRSLVLCFFKKREWPNSGSITLQGTNISHLGERKIIFKSAFGMGYVSSLEGKLLIWKGNQTMQRYDKFQGFPLKSAFS